MTLKSPIPQSSGLSLKLNSICYMTECFLYNYQTQRFDCSPQFFQLFCKLLIFVKLFAFLHFPSVAHQNAEILLTIFFFLLIKTRLVFWPGFGDLFYLKVSENFMCFIFNDIFLVCAYTICNCGEISVACIILSGSLSSPSHGYSCIPFVLVYCIHLCD